jgi:hypothetical protein
LTCKTPSAIARACGIAPSEGRRPKLTADQAALV